MAAYPHAELTRSIIGAYYDVYNALGSGFREVVYSKALAVALKERGLTPRREVVLRVMFRGQRVGWFRADLIVNDLVLLELKALPSIEAAHVAQTLNELRAANLTVGLLLNFGPTPQFKRLVISGDPRSSEVRDRASRSRERSA